MTGDKSADRAHLFSWSEVDNGSRMSASARNRQRRPLGRKCPFVPLPAAAAIGSEAACHIRSGLRRRRQLESGAFSAYRLRWLVLPYPAKGRMPNTPIRGPFGKAHFRDGRRLHPSLAALRTFAPSPFGGCVFGSERRDGDFQLFKLSQDRFRGRGVPSGAHASGGTKATVLIVDSKQQAANLSDGAATYGEPTDDEFLPQLALHL